MYEEIDLTGISVLQKTASIDIFTNLISIYRLFQNLFFYAYI